MIAPMTKYSFILLNGQEDALLEKIQEIGLVDITRSVKPADEATRAIAAEIELIDGLVSGIGKVYVPEGTAPIEYKGEGSDDLERVVGGTLMCYTDAKGRIGTLAKDLEEKKIWGEFDAEKLSSLASAGVPVHFHKLSAKQFKAEWADEFALAEVGRTKDSVFFVVAGQDSLPGEIPAPGENHLKAAEDLKKTQEELQMYVGEIAWLKTRLPELEAKKAELLSQLDLRLAGLAAAPAAENTIVTLVGYAPSESDEKVTEALDAAGAFYVKEAAVVEDNPPISFRNNKFVKMFEVLTDMYGRPAYNGFDPTPFISVFFLLFFAMCMGDAGYGLILILAGLALKKVESFRSLAPLVVTLGIGTVVVGFFFHTFFSIDISQWAVFEPVKFLFVPDEIAGFAGGMVVAIIVGVLHLCLAMTVKAIEAVKVNGFKGSLGTLGWTLLIVGGIIVAALALIGVLSSELTKWIVIVLGVVCAIGIFPLNTWGRNPLVNTGLGLWDTYNTVTGLLGDVLSYLRLYALGLAGGMLGMAFNDMGKMVLGDGTTWYLWPAFILLVLVGHTLNIAMCALGAFVHPLRLNFLEFFKNSGYEAAGRTYNPLKKL